MTISRRNLVKGAAWSAPAVLTSATIPAYAASNLTADYTKLYLYTETFTRATTTCNTSTNPQAGYISTLGTGNDPAVSVGWWNEDDKGGTVNIGQMTVTYTFSQPFKVVDSPRGTANWTQKTVYNGWTVTQPTPYTVTLTKTPGVVQASTAAINTGTNFGNYFLNIIFDKCLYGTAITVKTDASGTYSDKTTKNAPFEKHTTGSTLKSA